MFFDLLHTRMRCNEFSNRRIFRVTLYNPVVVISEEGEFHLLKLWHLRKCNLVGILFDQNLEVGQEARKTKI